MRRDQNAGAMESQRVLEIFLTRLFAAKCSTFATFIVLLYDHMITFDQEVVRIWRQPWTGATVLFMLNRYITPSQFTLQIMSMIYPPWQGRVCDHLFRLPAAASLFSTAMAEFILILRTYALYGQSKVVLVILLSLFVGHLAVMCLAVSVGARPDPLPSGIVGCVMTGSGPTFVLFWTTPWIADTVILALTIFKTVQYRRRHAQTRLLHVLARDGALFYAVIFAINTVNIAIYLFTPQGVKPIGAPFCQTLTTTMISRLQLNLRASRARPGLSAVVTTQTSAPPGLSTNVVIPGSTLSVRPAIPHDCGSHAGTHRSAFDSFKSGDTSRLDWDGESDAGLSEEFGEGGESGWRAWVHRTCDVLGAPVSLRVSGLDLDDERDARTTETYELREGMGVQSPDSEVGTDGI